MAVTKNAVCSGAAIMELAWTVRYKIPSAVTKSLNLEIKTALIVGMSVTK